MEYGVPFSNGFSFKSIVEENGGGRKKRRRFETNDISSLPPIESLKPEELKHFSKEQIVAYLRSQGVDATTDETKPKLKHQLRQVLQQLEKQRPSVGGRVVSINQSVYTPSPLPPPQHQQPISIPRQQTRESSVPSYLNLKSKATKTVNCPRCGKLVSCVGSNFLIHLSKCDYDFFVEFVQSDMDITELIPEMEEQEESSTPISVAKQNAKQRYTLNVECLDEIFSTTTIEEIIQSIPPPAILDFEQVERMMETVDASIAALTQKQKEFELESQLFMKHFTKLKQCESLEELESCKRHFEEEYKVKFEPARELLVEVTNNNES